MKERKTLRGMDGRKEFYCNKEHLPEQSVIGALWYSNCRKAFRYNTKY
jgi:hypothetical protein